MNLRNGTFLGGWFCIDFVIVPSVGLKFMNMSNFGARENPKTKREEMERKHKLFESCVH
jgi:hypothetical protein